MDRRTALSVAKRAFAEYGGCSMPAAFRELWPDFAEFLTEEMVNRVAQEHSKQYINPTARVHYTFKTVFFETELAKALKL